MRKNVNILLPNFVVPRALSRYRSKITGVFEFSVVVTHNQIVKHNVTILLTAPSCKLCVRLPDTNLIDATTYYQNLARTTNLPTIGVSHA